MTAFLPSKPRRGRRLAGLAVAVAAALTASGCGTVQSGAAAVVGDRRISVAELQQATTDLQSYVNARPNATGAKQTVGQDQVLLYLVLEPYLVKAASDAGVGVSDDEARSKFTTAKVAKPSQGAVDVLRADFALSSLTQARKAQELNSVAEQVRSLKIEVNPRYGKFDPQQILIVPTTPDWLLQPSGAAGPAGAGTPAPDAPTP
ncbi:MAG TPA: SurA N-terminal domain-containing protein [Kineosporiaceae bacterium]|nr:SurA N-terminal domain-containing protein [Kineosporiaceae bacterium]